MNKKALGLAGLGAVALVGGSLAYFSQTSTLENPFTTGSYKTDLHEDYTPPTSDLKPGAKWEKKVGATNTGDYPVLVRISMQEEWTEKDGTKPYKVLDSKNRELFIDNGTYENDKFIADQTDVVQETPENLTGDVDGLVEGRDSENPNTGEGTVVHKILNLKDSGDVEGWIYDNGYFYWTRVLEANNADGTNAASKTGNLMDNLVLASNIDLGLYNTKEFYQIADKKATEPSPDTETVKNWFEVTKVTTLEGKPAYEILKKEANGNIITIVAEDENKDGQVDPIDIALKLGVTENSDKKLFWKSESRIDEDKTGYADSNYTLSITAEFVQATEDAVVAEWGDGIVTDKGDKKAILTKVDTKEGDTTLVNTK